MIAMISGNEALASNTGDSIVTLEELYEVTEACDATNEPEWCLQIDTETIQVGATTDQPWQVYFEAATVTPVEETISNADLLNY